MKMVRSLLSSTSGKGLARAMRFLSSLSFTISELATASATFSDVAPNSFMRVKAAMTSMGTTEEGRKKKVREHYEEGKVE